MGSFGGNIPNYRQILSVEIIDKTGITKMFSLETKPRDALKFLLEDLDFRIPTEGTVTIRSELK